MKLFSQFTISGTVYDISKRNMVGGVKVENTNGNSVITDSMGRYTLPITEKDSIFFTYCNKPTQKFTIKDIADPYHFDIALQIAVKTKYSTLKEVVVYGKTYKQDSIENRETYAGIFGYKKPGLQTGVTPDGSVGIDINEIVNIFRFKRNKQLKAFRTRLESEEKEKYVSYRFNKTLVKRITGLNGEQLDFFMKKYRPTYEFIRNKTEVEFNQYILNTYYKFQIELSMDKKK